MAHIEQPRQHTLVDSALGIGLVAVGDTLNSLVVSYEGRDNIGKANETLVNGGTVLLVSDHPSAIASIHTIGVITRYLPARKKSAAILKYEYISPDANDANLEGRAIVESLTKKGILSYGVKTSKYTPEAKKRDEYNKATLRKCIELLHEPSSVLLTFASGTRSSVMLKAEPGMNHFPALADVVIPLTTASRTGRPTIIIHAPIPGKNGVKWCNNRFGKMNRMGEQVFANLVMTIIASGQPDEMKRGFYGGKCAALEGFLRNPGIASVNGIVLPHVVQAYIAWRGGEFNVPAPKEVTEE